jgi:DNA-binding NarL/FixJ family response regulator
MANPIKVVIAGGDSLVREGLRALLAKEADIEIVGEGGGPSSAVRLVEQLDPDILLLELSMANMDGVSVLRRLQRLNKNTKIIVLTSSDDKNAFIEAMKSGCSGIVLKKSPVELIAKSIRKVHAGEIWLDTSTTAAVMQQFASDAEQGPRRGKRSTAVHPLSPREVEIVKLIAQGYRNKEIAEKIYISEQTVKNHLHNIFGKLGVSDRLELALYAIHKGVGSDAWESSPSSPALEDDAAND